MTAFTRGLPNVLFMTGILLLEFACARTDSLLPPHSDGFPAPSPSGVELASDAVGPETEALVPGEVCVMNADLEKAEEVDRFASSRGYVKKKRRVLPGLGIVITIFEVPQEKEVSQGIAELRKEFPSEVIDANHRYDLFGGESGGDPRRYGHQLVGWNEQAVQCAGEDLRIGMIDTPVNQSSPLLSHRPITIQSFLPEDTPGAPGEHGTAIATMLVGGPSSAGSPLLPEARLFVAEAFSLSDSNRVESTTWTIVRALDWLISQKVQVINLSLGGPHNALLDLAITRTLRHRIPVVAAAGNSGPQGQPAYPAAQHGVIAVTALDAKLRPYNFATKGFYLTFAAPGVDIWVPTGETSGTFRSGTSFAAPFVTTGVAALRTAHPTWPPSLVVQELAKQALDLGTEGKDEIFGWGLVQVPNSCQKLSSPAHT